MESDRSVYYTFKYLPIGGGLMFILFPVLAHVYPDDFIFNGQPGAPDLWTTAIFILVGLLLGMIPFLYMDKLVIVEISNQNIKIKKGKQVLVVNWLDVEKVAILPAIFPPLYKLQLKAYKGSGDGTLLRSLHF